MARVSINPLLARVTGMHGQAKAGNMVSYLPAIPDIPGEEGRELEEEVVRVW